MSRNKITSAELLAAAGIIQRSSDKIPLEHRHLLITAVLECVPERELKAFLIDKGHEVSLREVGRWLRNTREWLGLPAISQGRPSAHYLAKIEKWREANGNPTLDQIDNGWIPPNRRKEENELAASKLSPRRRAELIEFREMLASLEAATDDQVQILFQKYKEQIESKLSKKSPSLEISPPEKPELEQNENKS